MRMIALGLAFDGCRSDMAALVPRTWPPISIRLSPTRLDSHGRAGLDHPMAIPLTDRRVRDYYAAGCNSSATMAPSLRRMRMSTSLALDSRLLRGAMNNGSNPPRKGRVKPFWELALRR